MTFLTFSLFLGGLMAATIPIALHLFMRGKPRVIEFPALMFLKKRLDIQKRQYRLKHWTLLVLRILLCVLIGLALARPSLRMGDWLPLTAYNSSRSAALKSNDGRRNFISGIASSLTSQEAPIAVALVVDSSIRMSFVQENQDRLAVAQDFAHGILNHIPIDSDIAVLSCERESAVFQVDVLAAGAKIDHLQITPHGRNVLDATQDALALLAESKHAQRELYILTDLTAAGWPDDGKKTLQNLIAGMNSPATLLDSASQNELGIFVVDVGVDNPTNSALDRVRVFPETATAQSPIRLDVELWHEGAAQEKIVEVILTNAANNEEQVRASKMIAFPARPDGGPVQRSATFSLTGFGPGTHQGKLRFTVPDALTADDEAYFTVEVQSPWKLLIFAPPPVRESARYLVEALKTVELFTLETAPLSALPGMTLAELDQFRGLILLDPVPMPPTVWKKLADYATTGHGLGVFLGPNANNLTAFNDPATTAVLGAKLVQQAREPSGELWFVPSGEMSSIFTPFRQFRQLETFPWEALPVFRYWQMSELSPRAEIAAEYIDGRPAVIVQPLGQGQIVTVTTPISELPDARTPWKQLPWNTWSRSEAPYMFLLLMEGIAKHLIGVRETHFNFTAGQQAVLHLATQSNLSKLPTTCLMTTPSGQPVSLTPDSVLRQIVVPTVDELGNYRIRSGGAQETLNTGISVNLPAGITHLQRMDEARLNAVLGEGNFKWVRSPQEIEQGIARRRVGQELFPMLMLILAAFWATEYVFSNRFYAKTIGTKEEHAI